MVHYTNRVIRHRSSSLLYASLGVYIAGNYSGKVNFRNVCSSNIYLHLFCMFPSIRVSCQWSSKMVGMSSWQRLRVCTWKGNSRAVAKLANF